MENKAVGRKAPLGGVSMFLQPINQLSPSQVCVAITTEGLRARHFFPDPAIFIAYATAFVPSPALDPLSSQLPD